MTQVTGTADATTSFGVKGENANPPPSRFVIDPLFSGPPATGVWGDAPNFTGVTGTSNAGVGVWGGSQTGPGVLPGQVAYGRYGLLGGVDPMFEQDAGAAGVSAHQGVFGHSTGETGTGVYGNGYYALRGDSPNGTGFIGGVDPQFKQKAGVYGSSDQQGVIGASTGGHGTAVYGDSTDGFAIRGETSGAAGTAIKGAASGGGSAGLFDGKVTVENGDLTVTTGNIVVQQGDVLLQGKDCAEDFDLVGHELAAPGTVMVMGEAGAVAPCRRAYDRRVAGVVSGAGDLKSGIVLGRRLAAEPCATIALIGTVYCHVDADEAAIEIGDLLTTSATEGHAMKAEDRDRAFGAVIGKAMRGLPSGRGLIPVLIALQ